MANAGEAVAAVVADAVADAVRANPETSPTMFDTAGPLVRAYAIGVLDQWRVVRGMPPAVDVAIELLEELVRIGHEDQVAKPTAVKEY